MLKNWLIVARRAARAFDVRRHNIPVVLWQLPFPLPAALLYLLLLLLLLLVLCCLPAKGITAAEIFASICFSHHHTLLPQCMCHVCVYKCVCICVCACWKLSRLALKSFFANIATARSLQAICHWNSWTCCCFYSVVVVVAAMLLLLLCCCCFFSVAVAAETAFRKCAHLSICQLLYNY